MKQKNVFIAIILISIIVFTVGITWQLLPKTSTGPTGPISVIDDLGRNVTITNYPPERIVSLAPSSTEILFALGLGDKIVGVDSYSDYPPDAINIEPKVGSFSSINIETVLGLQPDLVLATGGIQRIVVEALEELGVVVVALYPQNISAVLSDITLVGKITGKISEANVLITDISERIQDIADITQDALRPRVYIEYFFNGGYWSYGSASMVNEMIYNAGGINVFAGFAGDYMSTSDEAIINADPEVIIISQGAMAESCGLTIDVIKGRMGWGDVSAVENDRIYEIDEAMLVRPGPRIVDAIETLAYLIHPELFS
ncbi:MAG: cobalamin-binding protein [Nitrososphaerales archaeon]|nr:cobalamin-binding protein [Nitrososphaerales archaeon]